MAGVKKKDIPDIAAFMPEFWEICEKRMDPGRLGSVLERSM